MFYSRFKLKHLCWALGISGWLLTFFFAWHLRHRIANALNSRESRTAIEEHVNIRRAEMLEVVWQDIRKPVLFIGDSQIERGDWYTLFRGKFSVRNYGVSGSRVTDALIIAEDVPADEMSGLVMLCGINDLAAGYEVGHCMRNFAKLLELLSNKASGKPVFVVSVLPVDRSFGHMSAKEVNEKVRELNSQLKSEAESRGFIYVDAHAHLVVDGKISDEYNFDGLHLTDEGYQVVSREIGKALSNAGVNQEYID